MKPANFTTSSCRYCRYYQAEGRRGGTCNQLSVPVRGEWKACTLAACLFTNTWENLEDLVRLEQNLALPSKGDRRETQETNISEETAITVRVPSTR